MNLEGYVQPAALVNTNHPDVKAHVFGNDKDIGVRIFLEPHLRIAKSKEMGYEVFEDEVMIEYQIDKFTSAKRVITENDKRRNPELWDRFQKGLGTKGTMIQNWQMISPAENAMMVSQGFITVEQLAEIPDGRLESLPPAAREIRQKARAHVNAKEGRIDGEKLGETILELRRRMTALEQENSELKTPKKNKGGRPKKVESVQLVETEIS